MNKVSKKYDLCVVGSGPAGMITVLEYARLNPNKKIVLLEYGKEGASIKNALDDSIQIDNLVNHHDPYECTNKGLGGSSATWGGRCVMFDEVDFIPRQVVGNECTWDLKLYHETKKFWQQTANYFECGEAVFDLNKISTILKKPIADNFKGGIVTDTMLERWSMPTRFGSRYRSELEKLPNVTLLEGYEARSFDEVEGIVNKLVIRKVGMQEYEEIQAEAYVLANGTQEVTRFLLKNKQLFNNLGFVPPALGKYYQSHVSGKIASVCFNGNPQNTDFGFLQDDEGVYLRRRFLFDNQFLVEKNLLNTAIWLDNPLYFDPNHRSGAMSFMYLAMITPFLGKKLAPPAIARSITKGKITAIDKHLWNIIKDFPKSLVTPFTIFYKRYLLKRKLPGVFLYSPSNTYALHFHAEQAPVEANYMELGQDGESLKIHYKLVDDDINSVIKIHEILDEYLQKLDCGRLIYWYPKEKLADMIRLNSKDGIHQSGTTRIADSPEKGVVDRDLKVWGTQNVYVCSSSVFPTSGQANPTFFLGTFAVRLAHYLTKQDAKS
ncbi:MAG: GMC family oxidoreductase [Runella zeae]